MPAYEQGAVQRETPHSAGNAASSGGRGGGHGAVVVHYPRTRIAQVSFATFFMTLGTRLKRLIDGGRFSLM